MVHVGGYGRGTGSVCHGGWGAFEAASGADVGIMKQPPSVLCTSVTVAFLRLFEINWCSEYDL